ncbi:hypothetical protein DQS14_22825 [Salmonella enterica subsp. enterica serovar Typhimurium]|nr:hypothetical protein [Salmonella enterica subsp. enterica serovar Typhimurium]
MLLMVAVIQFMMLQPLSKPNEKYISNGNGKINLKLIMKIGLKNILRSLIMENKITINKLMWNCGLFIFVFCSFIFLLASIPLSTHMNETAYNIRGVIIVLLIISNVLSGAFFLGNLLTYIEQQKKQ